MELYYAVSGSGAVLHTINPRLHPEQIAWIVNHAEDRALFFDLTFLPIIEAIAPHCPTVKHWVAMTDRAHMPARQASNLLCYEDLLGSHSDRLRLAGVRRERRLVAVLHVRHHRQSEGRAVLAPLDGAACVRGGAARCDERVGTRRDPAGGADVPRQCLGPAVRGVHGRARRWCSRARTLDGKSLHELFEAER